MSRRHLFTSVAGVRYDMVDGDKDGEFHIIGKADAQAILDRNMAMRNHNDGWAPGKGLRRAASIPLHLIEHWKQTEGWDAFNPDHADKLAQKLNDPDYFYLRTAEWRVGYHPDRGVH